MPSGKQSYQSNYLKFLDAIFHYCCVVIPQNSTNEVTVQKVSVIQRHLVGDLEKTAAQAVVLFDRLPEWQVLVKA